MITGSSNSLDSIYDTLSEIQWNISSLIYCFVILQYSIMAYKNVLKWNLPGLDIEANALSFN